MSEELEIESEQPVSHTWLHVGGPFNGVCRTYHPDILGDPPASVTTTFAVTNAAPVVSPPSPDAVTTFDATYDLELLRCGDRQLSIYRYAELPLFDAISALTKYYRPESNRLKLLEAFADDVAEGTLESLLKSGFSLRSLLHRSAGGYPR